MWEKIGDILSTLHEGVTIADENGIFVYASPTCRESFGVESEEILGRSARLLEENGIFCPCITAQVIKKKQKIQTVQRNRDGREIFVTGGPQFDDKGQLSGVICYSSWEVTDYGDLKSSYDKLKQDNRMLRQEIRELKQLKENTADIIEHSKVTRDSIRLLNKFGSVDSPVMISGPDGVGKKFLANRVFHPELEYSCELVNENVMEDELFDILGAAEGRAVLLQHAESLSLPLKKRLAEYIRANGTKVIITSDKTLEQMRNEGTSPDDFYYLFRVCEVVIPPINERFEDLNAFIDYYLEMFNKKYNRTISFAPSAMECLLSYAWPENINEIKYVIERIVLTSESEKLEAYQLPQKISDESSELFTKTSLKDALEFYERGIIQRAYEKYKTTVKVSQELGISQATAVRKIKKYIEK